MEKVSAFSVYRSIKLVPGKKKKKSLSKTATKRLRDAVTFAASPERELDVPTYQEPKTKDTKKSKKSSKSPRKNETISPDKDENCSCSHSETELHTPSISPTKRAKKSKQKKAGGEKDVVGEKSRQSFESLIYPVTVKTFYNEVWEKKPLLLRRHNPHYHNGWFSCHDLDQILRQKVVKFTENLDVTSYRDGKRQTHNPEGRAHASNVWQFYEDGCSVRMLNPQVFSNDIWEKLSTLQEWFGCFTGANIYLTPPGSQGFAPHYDDIDAFILQLEGKKRWRLYAPRSEEEVLPLFSSGNFSQDEIGEAILDTWLEAGDCLYFPRGYIHQAITSEDTHSLHITVSANQKNTWGDYFKLLLPVALELALEENVEFRKSIPRDFMDFMGVVNSSQPSERREEFVEHVQRLFRGLVDSLPVDAACDQMAKRFVHDSLPPVLSKDEKSRTVSARGERWDPVSASVAGGAAFSLATEIRLLRKRCAWLLVENEKMHLYYSLENSRLYREEEAQYIEVEPQVVDAVEYLLQRFPKYVRVAELPGLEDEEERLSVVSALYDKGLIMTRT